MKSISQLINLQNRNAIVTGGAGHIGRAVCEAFLELGATVYVLDLDPETCANQCHLMNTMNFGGTAIPVAADLSKEADTRNAISDIAKKSECIDIIVHCAAFTGTTTYPGWAVPFEQQTVQAWNACLQVNLTAAFVITQTALPYLRKSAHAAIIFISSIYGVAGPDNRLYEGTEMVTPAAYAASKAGLEQLARYLSTTLSPGIRVNTITAGGVYRNQAESFHKRYIQKTPLRRMAIEEDFKGAVAYLASDLSAYVTGTRLVVDGGWTAW